MKPSLLKELVAISNRLDQKGFGKEADLLDGIIKSAAAGDDNDNDIDIPAVSDFKPGKTHYDRFMKAWSEGGEDHEYFLDDTDYAIEHGEAAAYARKEGLPLPWAATSTPMFGVFERPNTEEVSEIARAAEDPVELKRKVEGTLVNKSAGDPYDYVFRIESGCFVVAGEPTPESGKRSAIGAKICPNGQLAPAWKTLMSKNPSLLKAWTLKRNASKTFHQILAAKDDAGKKTKIDFLQSIDDWMSTVAGMASGRLSIMDALSDD